MTEVTVTTDGGFVVEAEIIGAALGIDPSLVPKRMRTGEITSRFEAGIDEDAGRFRLTFFSRDRALRLTVDGQGKVLSRSTFPVGHRRGPGQTLQTQDFGSSEG